MRIVCSLALLAMLVGCGGTDPGTDDMTMPGDAAGDGGLPFGSPCTMNSDCESNICFIGGNRTFCSIHCSIPTASTDCPVPPTSGTCNMQGYCKP
jgi:hypothetical protein